MVTKLPRFSDSRPTDVPLRTSGGASPRVSIVMPAYRSDRTLGASLAAIAAQTFTDFEIIVVDSTPDDGEEGRRARTRAVINTASLEVRCLESAAPLLPHAARNLGVSQARGMLLVFTDPDIYPQADWLARLVGAFDVRGGVIFGALACQGRRWFDVGVHLCKFGICLPEGKARPVIYGWSGSMLCSRDAFDLVGGFPTDNWHGDTLLSARFRRAGLPQWFDPSAVVSHDHALIRLRPFLRERFIRGAELARLSGDGALTGTPWTPLARVRRAVTTTVWPVKVLWACFAVGRGARRAGLLGDFVWTFPVIVAGQAAWVLGDSWQKLRD